MFIADSFHLEAKPEPETYAQKMRKIFGDNGEHWCQLAYHQGDSSFCLIGALHYAHTGLANFDNNAGIQYTPQYKMLEAIIRRRYQRDRAVALGQLATQFPDLSEDERIAITYASDNGAPRGIDNDTETPEGYNDHPETGWGDIDEILTALHGQELVRR